MKRTFLPGKVIPVNCRRVKERAEAVEKLVIVPLARQVQEVSGCWNCAWSRKGNVTQKTAVTIKAAQLVMGMMEIKGHKFLVYYDHSFQGIDRFGDNRLPVGPGRLVDVNGQQTAARRVQVSAKVKTRTIVADEGEVGLQVRHQGHNRSIAV